MTFAIKLDLENVAALLEAGAEDGVRLAAEHLLTEANKHVPHDEGTLERTGAASYDGLVGAVSYDTPYAVRQHEDMSAHHHGKGQAKWLENTMAQESKTIGAIIATSIRGKLGS